MTTIHDLRVEHHRSALGIGEASPRLSWELSSDDWNVAQVSYQVRAHFDDGTSEISLPITSANTLLQPWPFAPLRSRQRVTVSVRSATSTEATTDWSSPLVVEAGLFDRDDWAEDFVSPSQTAEPGYARPGYVLRADFTVPEGMHIRRARIYATAHGVYELELNGSRVGDQLLAPGWTSYSHRLRYQTYDITDQLVEGRNGLGAWLADGWYRGKLGFNGGLWNNYGEDVALLAQVELTLLDGTVEHVPLSTTWKWAESPITSVGLYEGEEFDAGAALLSPSTVAAGEWSAWSDVAVLPLETFAAELVAPDGPPVRVTEVLSVQTVEKTANGRIRLDFGQNISGRLAIKVRGERGRVVTLHHAEVLDKGELAIRPLRGAPSVDRYTLAGTGEVEEWAPRFTFHGFRYAELEGWPGEFDPSMVVAEVLHSDMARAGHFASSNPLVDQLHENVVWSMRDNFVDLPTDCPQRDERLGWTGDIQVFGPTAAFLYHSTGTLRSWLQDVAAEQRERGSVPNFVPWIECGFPEDPAAAWGDVVVHLPWTIYQRTGDAKILRDQFASMRAWVDQVDVLTGGTGLWDQGFQLGDWLDPAAPPEKPDESKTDRYLVATAYHARSAHLLAKTAEVLGEVDAHARYSAIADTAMSAFRAEFVSPSGRVVSDTETALSLAIVFELLDGKDQIARAGARLAELVQDGGYTIRTGFVGTPIICDALAAVGRHDVAYHLLLQTTNPSWLYPVTMGATTIWERWDSMLPDGSINPGEMTSFNHYSLGAVADYLHRVVAGLAPAKPGYKVIRFEPQPGGGLTRASARHLTPYGPAESSWTRNGEDFSLEITVPIGTTAEVVLPGLGVVSRVGAGTHSFGSTYRAPENDPEPVAKINLHDAEEREREKERERLLQAS